MTYKLLTIICLFSIIVISTIVWKTIGLAGSVGLCFFSVHFWGSFFKNNNRVRLNVVMNNAKEFFSDGFIRVALLFAINFSFYVIAWIFTMISDLFLLYFVAAFLGYLYAYLTKKVKHKYFLSFGVFPLFLSVFFMLNLLINFNPVQETYSFVRTYERYREVEDTDSFRTTSRIRLEDEVYLEYKGMRSFFDENSIKGRTITYTISEGLFGFRVVNGYVFN